MRKTRKKYQSMTIKFKLPNTIFGKSVPIILIVLVFFILYVWQRVEVVRMGHRITTIRERIEHWYNQNQYLRVKINESSAPQIIEKKAKETLNMIYPNSKNIKIFSTKGIVKNGNVK